MGPERPEPTGRGRGQVLGTEFHHRSGRIDAQLKGLLDVG
jgi:hypothetical protein